MGSWKNTRMRTSDLGETLTYKERTDSTRGLLIGRADSKGIRS